MKPGSWTFEIVSEGGVTKGDWGLGPWNDEVDSEQFFDPETGYPCCVVRNMFGALNGYVGIPASNPAYGLSYDGIPQPEFKKRMRRYRWFAKQSTKIQRLKGSASRLKRMASGAWERAMRRFTFRDERENLTPVGREVGALRVHGGLTYAGPAARRPGPPTEPGSPGFVVERGDADFWLFGFDSGHAGDYQPGLAALTRKYGLGRAGAFDTLGADTGWGSRVEYRDLGYVREQIASLAKQLYAIEHPGSVQAAEDDDMVDDG